MQVTRGPAAVVTVRCAHCARTRPHAVAPALATVGQAADGSGWVVEQVGRTTSRARDRHPDDDPFFPAAGGGRSRATSDELRGRGTTLTCRRCHREVQVRLSRLRGRAREAAERGVREVWLP